MINGTMSMNPIGFDYGCIMIAENTGTITIGKNFGMSNSSLYSRCSIKIGDNVMLGGGVKIYDTDFHSLQCKYRGTSLDKQYTINRPVVIGNNVFIGAGSVILKGVTIGDRAIIGAGSVITHSIGEDEIWAGNPAVFIRKNNSIE